MSNSNSWRFQSRIFYEKNIVIYQTKEENFSGEMHIFHEYSVTKEKFPKK